jgi:hypothetical protein
MLDYLRITCAQAVELLATSCEAAYIFCTPARARWDSSTYKPGFAHSFVRTDAAAFSTAASRYITEARALLTHIIHTPNNNYYNLINK